MIQDKVFQMMADAEDRIIKTMQERGIKKVNLVMTQEEWAKENGFGPDDDPEIYEDDYNDYRNQEAPYVICFNKWANGIDYAAYSVELVDGPVEPCFKLECYNSEEGSEWFYDSDLTNLSMIGVYDAMEKELEMESEPNQEVWVFTAEQAWDGEAAETIVKAFPTKEAAQEYMHHFIHEDGDESVADYVERKGWCVEQDEPDFYRAYEEGRYSTDHIECTLTECKI